MNVHKFFLVLPSVQAVNQLLGAPEGTDVTLECSVEANPNAVNYWIKNPNKMLLEGFVKNFTFLNNIF